MSYLLKFLPGVQLGDTAHTYYKDKNPEEYNYHVNRLKALKNSPSKGVLGTFLPEVTVTASKKPGGSINYLHHFNISKAKDGEKIDWKEKFKDNPDGPKEIENWPSFSEVMDGVSYMVPGYGTYRSIKDAIADPTWYNIGSAALSGLGDLAMLTGFGIAGKAVIAGTKALKAAKFAKAADKGLQAGRAMKQIDNGKLIALTTELASIPKGALNTATHGESFK